MEVLKVVNRERQPVAQIIQDSSGTINMEIYEEAYRAPLTALVEKATQQGVRFLTGSIEQQDGHKIFVDEQIRVMAEDARFLRALADTINKSTDVEHYMFAVIAPQKGKTNV